MSEKIKILLLKHKMSVAELARKNGTSAQNFYNKLARDNFSEKELQEIADIVECNLEIKFITKNGESI